MPSPVSWHATPAALDAKNPDPWRTGDGRNAKAGAEALPTSKRESLMLARRCACWGKSHWVLGSCCGFAECADQKQASQFHFGCQVFRRFPSLLPCQAASFEVALAHLRRCTRDVATHVVVWFAACFCSAVAQSARLYPSSRDRLPVVGEIWSAKDGRHKGLGRLPGISAGWDLCPQYLLGDAKELVESVSFLFSGFSRTYSLTTDVCAVSGVDSSGVPINFVFAFPF